MTRICIDSEDQKRLSPGQKLALDAIRVTLALPPRAEVDSGVRESIEEAYGERDGD